MAENEVQHLTPDQLVDRWLKRSIVVSVQRLKEWRSKETGPAWIKIEGRIYYPLDFVEEYEQDNTHIPKK
jgi:hypothetical protein